MKNNPKLLIVEDDPKFREFLVSKLEADYEIIEATTGEECLQRIALCPDVVLLDVNLPPAKGRLAQRIGLDLIQKIHALDPLLEIVMMSGTWQDIETAVEAVRQGAYDYVTKEKIGADQERLPISIRNAVEKRRLEAENQRLDEQLSLMNQQQASRWGIKGFIGTSPTITKILNEVHQVQSIRTTSVLITGESGTGKELIARAIHFGGTRKDGPFVPVNCSAIPRELAESYLFGHVKGSFTGATANRKGYFELADKGTL